MGSNNDTPAPATLGMVPPEAWRRHAAWPPVATLVMRQLASNPSRVTLRSSGDHASLNDGWGQSERSRMSLVSPTGAICRLEVPRRLMRYETTRAAPALRDA